MGELGLERDVSHAQLKRKLNPQLYARRLPDVTGANEKAGTHHSPAATRNGLAGVTFDAC